MGDTKRQRDVKEALGNLADEVASQVGLPRPPAHVQEALKAAENALKIFKSKRIWMRNAKCMSDYSEVQHGYKRLLTFFSTPTNKDAFVSALDRCMPGAAAQGMKLFDQWLNDTHLNTYIASISEHDGSEDHHGRLSMWRAFAQATTGVALVMRLPLGPLVALSLHVTLVPVAYYSNDQLDAELKEVIRNVEASQDFLRTTDSQMMLGMVFALLQAMVVSLKHEGFREEREWRAVYAPKR
jgi:Protein of unknown function (DUF2971)